ncbi:MAG: CCA tRNA nucleotidyltransferase [Candidatus Omnitrophica bacterium]|nr:CCA tRNA nucleotidyltransferase [Candidatus Omnitrophota bacterium]
MKDLLSRFNLGSLALVRSIGVMAQAQGVAAFLVGGPVRDLMLKQPNIDLDIAVEGNGIRLAESFAARHRGALVTRYPAFKTATVRLHEGSLVDFATARDEIYVRGGAFPAVKPSDINKDLFRRDFTINAMAIAINPETYGKLIDPFEGTLDLRSKVLRILHEKSFLDDPTRILRAARFKARLGFRIEAKTLKLLKSAIKIKVLDTIKPQRYLKDFNKLLKEPNSQEAIKCLKSWNAYK